MCTVTQVETPLSRAFSHTHGSHSCCKHYQLVVLQQTQLFPLSPLVIIIIIIAGLLYEQKQNRKIEADSSHHVHAIKILKDLHQNMLSYFYVTIHSCSHIQKGFNQSFVNFILSNLYKKGNVSRGSSGCGRNLPLIALRGRVRSEVTGSS